MKYKSIKNEVSTLADLEEGLELNLQFAKRQGLLPVAVQETSTGQLLMLASVNEEALKKLLRQN